MRESWGDSGTMLGDAVGDEGCGCRHCQVTLGQKGCGGCCCCLLVMCWDVGCGGHIHHCHQHAGAGVVAAVVVLVIAWLHWGWGPCSGGCRWGLGIIVVVG